MCKESCPFKGATSGNSIILDVGETGNVVWCIYAYESSEVGALSEGCVATALIDLARENQIGWVSGLIPADCGVLGCPVRGMVKLRYQNRSQITNRLALAKLKGRSV